jgi:hypothetical protein
MPHPTTRPDSPGRSALDRPSDEAPALSVVVASFRSRDVLNSCLAALTPQCERLGAELIVARPPEAGDLNLLTHRYQAARVIAAGPGADLPRVRGAGLAAARGEFVALTEDHCVADVAWLECLARHAGGDADVVGGAMDTARRERAIDWAAFFAEYGFFAGQPPDTAGAPAVPLLTGANVAYARRVVADVAAWALDGTWENVVHDRLAARGSVLRFDGAARVSQNLSYQLSAFCADRYRHGRDYARARLAEWGGNRARRWLLAAAAPALPPVLAWRIARRVGRGPRRRAFAAALPITLAFLAAWSAGEAEGYLRGAR